MSNFDHFDFLAPHYERFIQPKDPQQMRRLTDLPADGPFLDAGGGTGRVAQFMVGKANPIIVADLSLKMLDKARAKSGLLAACSASEHLPFPTHFFARIIMVDALHHVIDQKKTILELWRTLKPGGRLVIEEPDLRIFTVKLLALAEKLALMRSHFLSPPAIVNLFNDLGAKVSIEVDGFNAWVVVEKPADLI
jgi:demethylmenaquinone methyltransferase/2-methoxy-6-polyprenyl-1,4-benzoquinol methylase